MMRRISFEGEAFEAEGVCRLMEVDGDSSSCFRPRLPTRKSVHGSEGTRPDGVVVECVLVKPLDD